MLILSALKILSRLRAADDNLHHLLKAHYQWDPPSYMLV